MSEIDWAALQQEAKDTVLPDGDYTSMVIKADAVTASTGKPMIKLQLVIVDGPKKDRKVFTQLVLSTENPFALQRWFGQLASFGLDAAYFATKPSMEKVASDLMNRGAVITLGQREWQGSMRNEVQGFRPYAPNGPLPPGMIIGPVAAGPQVTAPVLGPTPTVGAMPTAPTPTTATSAPSSEAPKRPF